MTVSGQGKNKTTKNITGSFKSGCSCGQPKSNIIRVYDSKINPKSDEVLADELFQKVMAHTTGEGCNIPDDRSDDEKSFGNACSTRSTSTDGTIRDRPNGNNFISLVRRVVYFFFLSIIQVL